MGLPIPARQYYMGFGAYAEVGPSAGFGAYAGQSYSGFAGTPDIQGQSCFAQLEL